MVFRFYSNTLSRASRGVAATIFVAGLLLIGFGLLIIALPELFALIAALMFFIAGGGCALTAAKIYFTQRRIDKMSAGGDQPYRENVDIHDEDV